MKTTLVVDDTVVPRVRDEAARTHRTISELVESALRGMLEAKPIEAEALKPLPMLQGGRFRSRGSVNAKRTPPPPRRSARRAGGAAA